MTGSNAQAAASALLVVLVSSGCGPDAAGAEQTLLPDDQSPFVRVFDRGDQESLISRT